MNLKIGAIAIAFAIIALIDTSCKNRGESKVTDMHTSDMSVDWEGTYTTVTRAADCPGIYVMLSLDTANYERMNKYLERRGIYIEKGKIELDGDKIKIGTLSYKIGENILYNNIDTLYKINEDKHLPDLFTKQLLIENSNDNAKAILREYTKGEKQMAQLNFMGKEYLLHLNESNFQSLEYIDGKYSLEREITDPAPLEEEAPIFSDGTTTHEFTINSPLNYLYTSSDNDNSYFDVIYFNDEETNIALLLRENRGECYILYQTSAGAKSAEYSNNEVKWITSGNKAELIKGDKKYKYTQQKIR